ncbi:glutamic acid-rich protein-like [Alexandromys fortis]|uniref:glutamic acid-rich protein-like n=1 Tax=Alexandromys fortis TaxID=100897 RepID=UPI002153A3E8|nr:glutamic acid-rich protein-like [Microtus fortis]
MSAIVEQEPGLPDQEQEGGGMEHNTNQIVLHVLPMEEAVDDIDGTAAFLVSQAVMRAITEEDCGQEEIWPNVDEIWPRVEDVWAGIGDIWSNAEEVWPDVEDGWYIWNSDQETDDQELQEEAGDNQDYNNEDEEEEEEEEEEDEDEDENDEDDDEDDDYEYEGEEENEEDHDENYQGEKIVLHACEFT